ncbi:MAG: hypothetical protein AAF821_26855, partial [Cyanobacteria bacterium P01_D01_bin.156]
MPDNNTLTTAVPIGLLGQTPQLFEEFVGSIDRNDFYRFELSENSDVTLLLSGLSEPGQINLLVDFDGDGIVDSNEDIEYDTIADFSNSIENRSIVRTLPAGTYWANVYTDDSDQNTGYTLTASATPVASVTPDPGNSLSDARDIGVLGSEQVFSDAVGSLDRNDLYRFELVENSEVNFLLSDLSEPGQINLLVDFDGDGIV